MAPQPQLADSNRPSPPSPQTSSSRKRIKRDEKMERSKKRKLEKTKAAAAPTTVPRETAATTDNASEWSKSKKKRMRANKAKIVKRNDNGASKEHDGGGAAVADVATRTQQQNPMATSKNDQRDNSLHADSIANTMTKQPLTTASSTLSKYQARLQGSRFRVLNEQLYTMHSKQAYAQFSTNPQLFQDYHAGFTSQVEHWPVQPVVLVADELKRLVDATAVYGDGETDRNNSRGAPRKQFPIVIADFGCGKAELAQDLLKCKSSNNDAAAAAAACPFQVHSFDLVASSNLVTPCDMSKTPLESGIVDVAVFCLSLMGNNLADFIREAHRVLKPSGIVKIVEVRSRFETTGDESGAAPDARSKKGKPGRNHKNDTTAPAKPISELKRFLNALDQLGFECVNLDRSNKMFFVLDLRKNGKHPDMSLEFTAKPCIYKRR